jgi:hypothetical protein
MDYKNFYIVSEGMIELCAANMENEDNNFQKMLDSGKLFRDAGLTPVFLCSETLQDISVTTMEKMRNLLH